MPTKKQSAPSKKPPVAAKPAADAELMAALGKAAAENIVIDEVCGIFVTFMIIPMTWFSAVLGFVLFRVFDVFKPFPIRLLERIPRYWGIMADDLGAGLYAWIILFVVFK